MQKKVQQNNPILSIVLVCKKYLREKKEGRFHRKSTESRYKPNRLVVTLKPTNKRNFLYNFFKI